MRAPCGAKGGNFAEGKVIRGKAADGSGRIEDSDFATSEDFAPGGRRLRFAESLSGFPGANLTGRWLV